MLGLDLLPEPRASDAFIQKIMLHTAVVAFVVIDLPDAMLVVYRPTLDRR
jgi:hypothetical protein